MAVRITGPAAPGFSFPGPVRSFPPCRRHRAAPQASCTEVESDSGGAVRQPSKMAEGRRQPRRTASCRKPRRGRRSRGSGRAARSGSPTSLGEPPVGHRGWIGTPYVGYQCKPTGIGLGGVPAVVLEGRLIRAICGIQYGEMAWSARPVAVDSAAPRSPLRAAGLRVGGCGRLSRVERVKTRNLLHFSPPQGA